ncbi:MAG TPA: hypothetical protein VLA34_14290, partial [Candidatus Krumholzibacterium sp.]|nr:hypothetical protein [Candidatus Krumholzibacterium sp.]
LFPSGKHPGWDARGDAFIRYGFPSVRRRIWGNVSERNVRMPGESWMYANPDTMFNFVDLYLSGEFFLIGSSTDRDPWTARDSGGLFEGSREGDPVSARRPVSGDGMEYSLDSIENSDLLKDMVDEVSARYGLEGFRPTGDENSFFLYPQLDLNMISFFDILCFRAGDNSIRTEVNLEVPLTELALKEQDGLLKGEVEMRLIVFDTDRNEVTRRSERFSVVSRGGPLQSAPGSLLGQVVLTLEPAPYSIWIEVEDLNGSRRSILKTRKWAHSLDGGLVISDIQFAKKVVESDEPNRYMKHNYVVIPHPLHLYRKPFPVTLYFEIYGLDTDREDHTFYSVEYEIEPIWDDSPGPRVKEKPRTVTSGFDTGGYGSTQPVRILIASDELEKGPNTLIVRVMDRRTREKVEKRSRFSIME